MQLRQRIVSSARSILSEDVKNYILNHVPDKMLYKFASIYPVLVTDMAEKSSWWAYVLLAGAAFLWWPFLIIKAWRRIIDLQRNNGRISQ